MAFESNIVIQILKRGADELPILPENESERSVFKKLEEHGLIAFYDAYWVTYAGQIYLKISQSGIGLDDGAIRSLFKRDEWDSMDLALKELQDNKLIAFRNETGMYEVTTHGWI